MSEAFLASDLFQPPEQHVLDGPFSCRGRGEPHRNVQASDRVELRKSAVVTGDISTQRISIEEGAYLKGKVDIQGKADKAAGK